jgi:hypothetical protein
MKRELLALCAACALAASALVSSAAADPINAKNALKVQASCTNGKAVQVVVNGNGTFSAAHVVGSTAVFVPYSFNLTSKFTPTGGATQTDVETSAKTGPHKGAVTCTIPFQSFTNSGGTFSIEGTVVGFFTPRR